MPQLDLDRYHQDLTLIEMQVPNENQESLNIIAQPASDLKTIEILPALTSSKTALTFQQVTKATYLDSMIKL